MLRTFETHHIRKSTELSGKLWRFEALTGEQKGKVRQVMVPSCIETYPEFENYRGKAAYETSFEAEGNVRLECKGVSHYAEVYVDGRKMKEHYGSYTPFDVCLTGIEAGEHSLKIIVDNQFKEDYALDFPNDYMSYGGITRGILLEEISDLNLSWIHVTPIAEERGEWNVTVEIACRNLTGNTKRADLQIHLVDEVIFVKDIVIPAGENTILQKQIRVKGVTSWTMETPVLYDVSAVIIQEGIEKDDLIDRIGFRTVTIDKNRVLLNGKALRIKGFCRHEDHPQYGCALPAAAIAYDLQLIKDLGANSIRTSHYPNDELFLDLCDELGILVWEENHARGIGEERMKNPHFEEQCEQVIREMITTHYNHPCIYIWGILNECGSETEYGRKCYQAQYQLIQELDKSRPFSSASCKYDADICQDIEKVCSWNMYPYWYDEDTATQKLEHIYGWLQEEKRGKGKPFLVTEVGAGAIYGFHSTAHEKWSEEEQEEILKKQLTEIAEFTNCMGMYIWQFCDVRVSKEWAMRRPRSRNNKGIVDEYRRPKLAYRTVKEIFMNIPDYWKE